MHSRKAKALSNLAVPLPLDTPTILASEESQAVADALNPLIADAFALYVKVKNYHWHITGPHFHDYHLLLDEQAETVLSTIDILAERIRKIGQTTIRGIKDISRLQTIEDDLDEFVPAGQMIRNLMQDNLLVAELQRNAIEICDKNRDTPTSNRLQEILDGTERRIWFLYEVIQDAMSATEVQMDEKVPARQDETSTARQSRM